MNAASLTTPTSLTAVSPLDGRYLRHVEELASMTSEFGLMRYRVRVEVEWFLFLAGLAEIAALPNIEPSQAAAAQAIWRDFDVADADAIKRLEAETNHDVKAVEYFVKAALGRIDGLAAHVEFVHFGCTSEDINNLAYALMLAEARATVLVPAMWRLIDALRDLAVPLLDEPMLSRTHGQAASPTTVGKELANVVARLERQLYVFDGIEILAKMNGAVGNYNAHVVAFPQVDWPGRSRDFVIRLGLGFNAYTTQIEPHDYIAELGHCLMRFNQVLLDFNRDMWGYIALGYFRQRKVEGETGSSTMPHKVNPIDFENSEGNVGLANALLAHLAEKLPVSRWQRDLSDSTALRNVGTALGHCLIAYSSARRGIAKLELDRDRLAADLDGAWEVLSEAVQTVMRSIGSAEPYEQLKRLTRGQQMDERIYQALLERLDLPAAVRRKLASLTPATYTGFASRLAQNALGAANTVMVLEVPWDMYAESLMHVRRAVFIEEQGVDEEEELDGEDAASRHFLAIDDQDRPVGVARLMSSGQIGRIAVLPAWRRRGVGTRLLGRAIGVAERQGLTVFLHAQADALYFYKCNGFVACGDVFLEAGIEHRRMTLSTRDGAQQVQ